MFVPQTESGYDAFEVVSALQKEIRRGNKYEAVYWGLQLFPKFHAYLWNRLLVISVEDVNDPMIHVAVKMMYDSFNLTGKKGKDGKPKFHRIFITRAIVAMCEAEKNRNVDHYQNLVDQKVKNGEKLTVPEYALDKHTRRGKQMGKTTLQFFEDEYAALQPAVEDEQDKKAALTLFDYLKRLNHNA